MTSFTDLTTIRVGGDAAETREPASEAELVDTVLDVWASSEPWLVLGGGSNLVVGDDGFEGTVIRVRTRGVEERPADSADQVVLRVQAGESWDELVAHTVSRGLAGLEALSGIPGSCGAAPIQNIGAYGQEVADSLVSIDFLDYLTGEVEHIPGEELQLGYRTSAIKQGKHGVVVALELRLTRTELSAPIAFPQLANALGVVVGERMPIAEVRDAVLALRSSKGMVLNPGDPDTVSCGSFFTNPIVSTDFASGLPSDAPHWVIRDTPPPAVIPLAAYDGQVPQPVRSESRVKLSAAWLIEHAGIVRGFSLPGSRAAISTKHTLAITNRGGATAEQVAELARFVQSRVLNQFGVLLQPEPVLVGVQL